MKNRLLMAMSLAFVQMLWAQTTKYFFVMIPPEMEDWMSAVPIISMDGGKSGKAMTAVVDMCGWYSYAFTDEEITDNVVLYRDDDTEREDMIGVNGNWEKEDRAQPIPLGFLLNMVDSLFFVPDEEQKTNDDGYYYSKAEVGGIEGTCSYTMAAIIYDTDASLHPAFSCYKDGGGEGCQMGALNIPAATAQQLVNACIGVTPGLVESKLDPSVPQSQRKPKLSTVGKKCFIDEKYFNQLFNYTSGVNEKSCFDMPFHRSNDGKWEFDSDFYTSPGLKVQGGFYPVEKTTDASILAADPNQTPILAARTKHTAWGPVFYGPDLRTEDPNEGVPVIDVLCNGPGWNKGMNCEGLFAESEETATAISKFLGLGANACVFGWSCPNDAPEGWAFFVSETETPSATGEPRWKSLENARGTGGRNQHFCFESHAKFTFKPGLKFNFRGDDDIWVFIDNTLAVDLGGTHLAAPGYVDLDSFKGYNGQLLEVGNTYDLDIFFCDRRTTMSNVRIKTNMYIMQRTGIEVKGRKNPTNPAETIYDHLCISVTGDGSCAAATTGSDNGSTYCGTQILESGRIPSYTLVNGKRINENVVPGFENVNVQGVYKCGIDLTNLVEPKVDKSKICLPGGYYTLFVTIDGKSRKVMSFKTVGEVDVLYKNGNAISVNEKTGDVNQKGKYTVKTTAMAGEMIPIYVSNVAPGTDADDLEIFPDDAVGMEYTLTYNNMMNVFRTVFDPATGTEVYQRLHSGEKQTIGPAGVDTLYASVDMENLQEPITPFEISVSGRANPLTVYFYLPQITFIKNIPEEDQNAVPVQGQTPKADGSYEENWAGKIYEMYLAVVKPNTDDTYSLCTEECNGLMIHKGSETSPKIDFIPEEVEFKNGYATISVRSLTKYRWDTDPSIHNPATIVAEYNDFVKAVYTPMYFRDPPVPFPVLADVFDARGSLPTLEHAIPSPYFSMQQEYLDGIGDSVAIYYDRPIHRDSLPSKICILWDSASAQRHNPYFEGFSTMPKDTTIDCNALLNVDSRNMDCSKPIEYNGMSNFCSNVITIGGLNLSKKMKTSGVGMVYVYSSFEDKGHQVKQGFATALIDRIAPVPLRAELGALTGTDYDSLVVYMSEPVKLITSSNKRDALDFYLNSATDLSELNRFVSILGNTSAKVSAQSEPALGVGFNGEGRIKCIYKRGGISPRVGDYVRLAGDMTNVFWSDTTDLTNLGGDTLRAVSDASYYWNSPTGYNETKRLSSRWIPIKGGAIDINSPNIDFAEPSFRVRMTGPFQFTIVMNESVASVKRNFAVMDLQGRIVKQGVINSTETTVPVLSSGTYVVKVGLGMRRVNVR